MAQNRRRGQNESMLTGEQDSSMQDNKNNYYEKLTMDKQSKGYQILREYVYYYGYNFKDICRLIDTQERQLVSKSDFRSILNVNKSDFYLTAEQIEEILTDLQSNFDGVDHYIPYADCYQLMSQYPPKTRHSIALLYGVKKKNPEDHQYDAWEKEIERQRRNFWDRKEQGQEWDFRYSDLNRLETSIMQSQRDEHGNIIQDEAEADLKGQGKFKQLTENEQYEKSIKNLYMMNNETILKNFDIKIAQHIAKIFKPSNIVSFTDEQLEKVFKNNLAGDIKRQGKLVKVKHYFEEDFEKKLELIILKQNRVMNDHFKDIKLTEDEIHLLHYRIWEDNNFGHFTYDTITKWVIKNRNQKTRELRTIGLSEQDQRRILNKQEASAPKLFKELVKYAYSFGLNFLHISLKPIIERDNYILLNNITLYFKSLSIQFQPQDINDLKFYLANHGCIHLQDTSNQGFLTTNMLLDTKKLIDLITREAQKIAMHTIDFKTVGNKSKEQSRRSIQSKIIQGVVNKLTVKLRVYTDENDLIEEIKLRKVVADNFAEIDQSDLDIIFSKLQNVTEPSKYVSQRKIYLPEFLDFLLGGPLFDDALFQKINEYEKNQKIKDLGIHQDQNKSLSLDGRQDTDRSRLYTNNLQNSPPQNRPQYKDLVLDADNFLDQNMNTQETNRSVNPGQFSFRPNQNQQPTPSQATQAIYTQENEEEPKKFSVITRESLQQQILNQKKAQQEGKKVKTVSDSSKQIGDTSFNREQKENTENNIPQYNEEDDTWTPDYRKIAIEELIQKEKPKPGIDYIKGGFVYDDNEDNAFVTKPLDDREVVFKLYESLKKKILVGKRAELTDFEAVDCVVLFFRRKLQAIDPTLRGVITLQQFYSFIKLNFPEFTPQECYQLKYMAESYSGTEEYQNEEERNISYTYFCMNLHKFICSNLLFTPNSEYQKR